MSSSEASTLIRDWNIYKITNPKGRVYVGITFNPITRKKNYESLECKKQPILYNSLKKYGWEDHKHEVIDIFSSDTSFAIGKEIFWIRTYMSCGYVFKEQMGMNSTIGGGGLGGMKHSSETKNKMSYARMGTKMSDVTKLKLSLSKKGCESYVRTQVTKNKVSLSRLGKKHSNETKKILSELRIGKSSPMKGIKLSEERKKQIGLSKIGNKNCLGKKHTLEHRSKIAEKRNIKISVYDLQGNLIENAPSLVGVSEKYSVNEGTIWRSASGKTKTHKKFIFKYT